MINICPYCRHATCVSLGVAGLDHAVLPVLHDEGEEVGHGGGPQLAQGVVVETGIQADDLKLDVYQAMSDNYLSINWNY